MKNNLNGLIEKPIFVSEDERVNDVLKKREEKGYQFHSFPVLDRQGKLVGIVTEDDFDFCDNGSLYIRDIMSRELVTAEENTTIDEAYEIMIRKKKKVIPLLNIQGEIKGMYVHSDVKRIKTNSAEMYNVDQKGRLRVAAAIGVGKEALERAERLIKRNVDVLVIDTAHADSDMVFNTLRDLKRNYTDVDVVVGNISIGDSAKRFLDAGVDGIKVGQGPGSICTTRVIAGIGRPQVSAVYDCARSISDDIPLCADGGFRNSGDIPIAIAAGAQSVMLGNMLAGTDEAPGDLVFRDGRHWKEYRGMGSIGAMENSKGSRERYLQTELGKNKLIAEGIEGIVPYKGKLKDVVFQYVGGLRSGMGYVGAAEIKELREKGEFDRITDAGKKESHPHDVVITKDAPNYGGVLDGIR